VPDPADVPEPRRPGKGVITGTINLEIHYQGNAVVSKNSHC
jgi:hypothetical protein